MLLLVLLCVLDGASSAMAAWPPGSLLWKDNQCKSRQFLGFISCHMSVGFTEMSLWHESLVTSVENILMSRCFSVSLPCAFPYLPETASVSNSSFPSASAHHM